MKFNYGKEKRKFEAMWERLRKEYKEAGMPEADIQKMYEYDWEMFKRERVFCRHNQFMPEGIFDDDTYREEGQSPLLKKFEGQLSVCDEYFSDGEFAWMEQIESERLRKCLQGLTEEQLMLLTEYYVQDKSVGEIAEERGLSYTAVANRLDRIRRTLRRY